MTISLTKPAEGTVGWAAAVNQNFTSIESAVNGNGLVLIEKKTITSDSQTITFSSLDGETEEVYLLVCRIRNNSGGIRYYEIRPNATTGSREAAQWHWTGGSSGTGNYSDWRLAREVPTAKAAFIVAFIYARKSVNSVGIGRFFFSFFSHQEGGSATDVGGECMAGYWDESSTTITSLDIRGDAASSIADGSTLALYRMTQS